MCLIIPYYYKKKIEDEINWIMKIKGPFMKVMPFNEAVKHPLFKPNFVIEKKIYSFFFQYPYYSNSTTFHDSHEILWGDYHFTQFQVWKLVYYYFGVFFSFLCLLLAYSFSLVISPKKKKNHYSWGGWLGHARMNIYILVSFQSLKTILWWANPRGSL